MRDKEEDVVRGDINRKARPPGRKKSRKKRKRRNSDVDGLMTRRI